jgi:hypothetical protein
LPKSKEIAMSTAQTTFMYIGIGTVAFFAFLMCCVGVLALLLLLDRWQVHRKARFGKHQTAGEIIQLDMTPLFPDLTEQQARDERMDQAANAALKRRHAANDETVVGLMGWEQETGGTVSYPFDMKGETIESGGAHKA